MPKVLVENTTSGYQYAGGYRIDSRCGVDHQPLSEDTSGTTFRGAVGLAFGVLVGLIIALMVALSVYTAGTPAYEPFFRLGDMSHIGVWASGVVGSIAGIVSLTKVRSAFDTVDLDEIGNWEDEEQPCMATAEGAPSSVDPELF
jgi:hypothetical protein